jgi:hypothetical protein
MNVSEQIDKYIQEAGKGSVRDALNVALATIAERDGLIDALRATIASLQEVEA